MKIEDIVNYFAEAAKALDNTGVAYGNFQPGVGPYPERALVRECLDYLKYAYPSDFAEAEIPSRRGSPDLLIPGQWAIEFKIARPYGDNGKEAEHWSQNLLHPYEGNTSSLGDALKLRATRHSANNALIVFTYSHDPSKIDLEPLIRSVEIIAREVLEIPLGNRHRCTFGSLRHPVHQQLACYGWEVLG